MLLLSTSSLTGYGLHRIFKIAKNAGYEGLDIALGILNYDLWDADYILELSDFFQLPVKNITAPSKDMSSEKFEKILAIAEKLGVKNIVFSPPHLTDKDTQWFGENLKKISETLSLHCCIQNVESSFLFFIIPEYRNATLEKIQSVTGMTAFDLMALDNSNGGDIMAAQAQLGASIQNIYFADKTSQQKGLIPGKAPGGLSFLPLESFLMRLKSIGYQGDITIKLSAKELGVGDISFVEANLTYVKKYYEKHFLHFS